MSSTRYDWWPYVKGMIRRWPKLKEKYSDLHSQFFLSPTKLLPETIYTKLKNERAQSGLYGG